MANVVSIVFDRSDRYPDMHRYGSTIDQRLDEIADRAGGWIQDMGNPRVDLKPLPVHVSLHETGPVFTVETTRMADIASVLDDVRVLARDWSQRDTGSHYKELSIKIRFGPRAAPDYSETTEWRRISIVTGPEMVGKHLLPILDAVQRLGEM